MREFPNSLERAIEQAKKATQLAIQEGISPLQIELVIPEIALQSQVLALEFTTLFQQYGSGLKVFFADTGAAALARRDWGQTSFQVSDLGSRFTSVETKVAPQDEAFLVVSPSSVEVNSVEKLCEIAGERPVVLLIPQLEDVSVVGIGYAARQLRERFLSTLESCYYFRPLEGAAVLRSHPCAWQVWLEKDDQYELLVEQSQKPMGEALELILAEARRGTDPAEEAIVAPQTGGLFKNLQRFLRALSQ